MDQVLVSEACGGFHPYISNPLLCKCGHPVQEHTAFMERHLKRKQEEALRQEELKTSVMKVLGVELIPDPSDEMIEISPGWKMKRREYEALRIVVLEKEAEKKKRTCTHKTPDGTSTIEGGVFCDDQGSPCCRLCGWS